LAKLHNNSPPWFEPPEPSRMVACFFRDRVSVGVVLLFQLKDCLNSSGEMFGFTLEQLVEALDRRRRW